MIEENSKRISKNSEKIDGNKTLIVSLEERMESFEKRIIKHEEESRKDRKAILDILYSYEKVTDSQYKENKKRIEELEEQFKIMSA